VVTGRSMQGGGTETAIGSWVRGGKAVDPLPPCGVDWRQTKTGPAAASIGMGGTMCRNCGEALMERTTGIGLELAR